PEGAAPPPMDIVCKVGFGKRSRNSLQAEANIYIHLKDLQGIAIPRYVGLFQGEMEDGRCACLVREYCGERLRKPLCGTKWDFRCEVVNLLRQIHDKGVEHGNFSEENIVIDVEGRPFLIDFSEAEKHECEATMPITIDDIQPMLKDFGCRELFNAAVLAEVWLPGTSSFHNLHYAHARLNSSQVKFSSWGSMCLHNSHSRQRCLQRVLPKVFLLTRRSRPDRSIMICSVQLSRREGGMSTIRGDGISCNPN
ncbi:hypothetical protein BKA93DRAFT_743304, partial [Sparassis latifolia]